LRAELIKRSDNAAFYYLTYKAFKELSSEEKSLLFGKDYHNNSKQVEQILRTVGKKIYQHVQTARCERIDFSEEGVFINAFIKNGIQTVSSATI